MLAAERLLNDLDRSDQRGLARNAIVLVAMAAGDDDRDQGPIVDRFATRTRAVFSGSDPWPEIAAAVADGR